MPMTIQARLIVVGEVDLAKVPAGQASFEGGVGTIAVGNPPSIPAPWRIYATRDGPCRLLDCTAEDPDTIAARIVSLIHRTLGEKSLVCP
jgi:hypothetical protein